MSSPLKVLYGNGVSCISAALKSVPNGTIHLITPKSSKEFQVKNNTKYMIDEVETPTEISIYLDVVDILQTSTHKDICLVLPENDNLASITKTHFKEKVFTEVHQVLIDDSDPAAVDTWLERVSESYGVHLDFDLIDLLATIYSVDRSLFFSTVSNIVFKTGYKGNISIKDVEHKIEPSVLLMWRILFEESPMYTKGEYIRGLQRVRNTEAVKLVTKACESQLKLVGEGTKDVLPIDIIDYLIVGDKISDNNTRLIRMLSALNISETL